MTVARMFSGKIDRVKREIRQIYIPKIAYYRPPETSKSARVT